MRNLLFGVILGLFGLVHSAPVDTVTSDDIYREVMTDGYLMDNLSTTSITTHLPKRNATVQESQQPSTESEETATVEDSDLEDPNDNSMTSTIPQQEGKHYATTTPSDSHLQSATSTELPKDSDDTSDSYTTQIYQQFPTESSSMTSVYNTESSTESSTFTTALKMIPRFFEESEGSGLGLVPEPEIQASVPSTTEKEERESKQPKDESSTESSTFTTALKMTPRFFEEIEGSGLGLVPEPEIQASVPSTTEKKERESHQPQEVEEPQKEITTVKSELTQNVISSIYNTESSTESSTFTTALKMTPRFFEEIEGSGLGLVPEPEIQASIPSTTEKEEKESHQPQEVEEPQKEITTLKSELTQNVISSVYNTESSTESSTFTTALKMTPRFFEESEGSGLGLVPEPEIQASIPSTTEKEERESNQPIEVDKLQREITTVKSELTQNVTSSIYNTESSTESSTFTTSLKMAPRFFEKSEGSGVGSVPEPGIQASVPSTTEKEEKESHQPQEAQELIRETGTDQTASAKNTGHSTPGWIIIIGFIVGVAALVMLCVAIATRDKWNRPSQASKLETKTNTTNQQRELEMETFIHKDNPKENGKAAEYTVIPLDEFPEKFSSQ